MARGDGWDVVVVGGVNTDYLARGPTLPTPGTGVEGDVFHVGPGGKGATQAVASARLGLARLQTHLWPSPNLDPGGEFI